MRPLTASQSRRIGLSALPLVLVALAGCAGLPAGAALPAGVGGGQASVVYEVIGPHRAQSVTYAADGRGGIAQEQEVTLPWRKEFQFDRGLAVATVSAQNVDSGDIICRITVAGEVVSETTSSGQYAVVSCASEAF